MPEDNTNSTISEVIPTNKNVKNNRRILYLLGFLFILIIILAGIFLVRGRSVEEEAIVKDNQSGVAAEKLVDDQTKRIVATSGASSVKPATPSATKDDSKPKLTLETKTYSNSEFNFSFEYPAEYKYFYYDVFDEKNHEVKFNECCLGAQAKISLLISETTTYQSMSDALTKGVSKAKVVEEFSINGTKGEKFESVPFEYQGEVYIIYSYLWFKDSILYKLSGKAAYEDQMDNIVKSFKFTAN